jgi:hypothetical protein
MMQLLLSAIAQPELIDDTGKSVVCALSSLLLALGYVSYLRVRDRRLPRRRRKMGNHRAV